MKNSKRNLTMFIEMCTINKCNGGGEEMDDNPGNTHGKTICSVYVKKNQLKIDFFDRL